MKSRLARVGDVVLAGERSRLVAAVALVLAITQLLFRAWALYGGWFFLDDYNLLNDARSNGLDLTYLLDPYNGHLMPGGRLLAWVVQASGPLDWTLAATFTLVLQAAATAAAWWMLSTLFGNRRLTLAPFALYLTTALTFPAFMWWAAALNLVPVQAAFFAAVAAWVTYLRGGRTIWLVITVTSLVGGLLFDVKAILVVPVLVYLALAYFETGHLVQRVLGFLRARRLAVGVALLIVAGYSAYYLANVPQIATGKNTGGVAAVAGTMLGTSFPTGVLGGPWRWEDVAPPTAYVDPPAWTVNLAWVVVFAVVAYGALRRDRTLRAWALALGYVLTLFVLLVTTRGSGFGGVIGLELRYLTDAACAVTLAVGLAFLPLVGAPEGSRARTQPLLRVAVPTPVIATLIVIVMSSGVYGSIVYAGYWHDDNASKPYLRNLQADLRAQGSVAIADGPVPEAVISNLAAPNNTVRRLVQLTGRPVTYPDATGRLAVVGSDGTLRGALIQTGVTSEPGPLRGCGWKVSQDGLRIPLEGNAFRWRWWVRIGYLSSADSAITVRAGESTVHTRVDRGANSLYVRVDGAFASVRLDDLGAGTTLCVDTVEVGQPVAGGLLS